MQEVKEREKRESKKERERVGEVLLHGIGGRRKRWRRTLRSEERRMSKKEKERRSDDDE